MNLNLTGHHVEITPAMRDYVTSKLSKITRHFDHVIDVTVILSVEKLQQKAEANVHVRGRDIFVETEGADQALGVSRTDALDHARAEVFFDAFESRRIDLGPMVDLKLQAVPRMALPDVGDLDLLAFRNVEGHTDDRCGRSAVFIQTRHRVMTLGVLVGDPADGALDGRKFVLCIRQKKFS